MVPTPITDLDPSELDRRIKAARLLRGVDQADLAQRFIEDGLDKHELGKLERGEFPLTRVRLDALVRHLRVPEAWFTSTNTDALVGYTPTESELTAEQRELVMQAAQLLVEADRASGQAKPQLREASAGPDPRGEPER